MTDVTIRPAEAADLGGLLRLYEDYHRELCAYGRYCDLDREALPSVLETRIRSRLIYAAAAESEGRLCGFAFCSISRIGREYRCGGAGTIGYLNDLYVAPEARRQGLAARLYAGCEAWLLENGVTALQLQALCGNESAQAFWRSRGFSPLAVVHYKPLPGKTTQN